MNDVEIGDVAMAYDDPMKGITYCSIGIQDPARTRTTQFLASFHQTSLTLDVDRAPSRIS
jgi:hypothetical protein